MTVKTTIKAIVVALCGACALTLTSCDTKKTSPKNYLKLSTNKVEVVLNSEATVEIKSGTAPFTVSSSDAKAVSATVKEKLITIKGLKVGDATVTVSDKNKSSSKIMVTVTKEAMGLNFDTKAIKIAVNKKATVTVSNGEMPYMVMVKDTNVASATVEKNKVTFTGLKKGSTTATVKDKNNKTGEITITVE